MMARIFATEYLQFFAALFLALYPFERAIAFPEPEKAQLVADRLSVISRENDKRINTLSNIYPTNQNPESMEAVCISTITGVMGETNKWISNLIKSIEDRKINTNQQNSSYSDKMLKDQVKETSIVMNTSGLMLNTTRNICSGIDDFEKVQPIIKSMMDDLFEIKSDLLIKLK
ncbi:hypothetical protein [Phenylobacterium sp.]|uniref:hypothetical protein n=1 Tax=Phenylobacterium sp. TaxID=1871053 RepID=UPI0025FB604A|nr:hypothetical protein [Phenylobacterium sp.]MCA3722131.1 hypothetical protein [Phenylobacterium sp.]